MSYDPKGRKGVDAIHRFLQVDQKRDTMGETRQDYAHKVINYAIPEEDMLDCARSVRRKVAHKNHLVQHHTKENDWAFVSTIP